MDEMDRVLAPLQEARAAVEKLDDYATPQELAVALEAIGQAVERSLRPLLRRDASQPDDIRLNAFDTALVPMDRVVVARTPELPPEATLVVRRLEVAR